MENNGPIALSDFDSIEEQIAYCREMVRYWRTLGHRLNAVKTAIQMPLKEVQRLCDEALLAKPTRSDVLGHIRSRGGPNADDTVDPG